MNGDGNGFIGSWRKDGISALGQLGDGGGGRFKMECKEYEMRWLGIKKRLETIIDQDKLEELIGDVSNLSLIEYLLARLSQ